ncbi:hypothetical protein [Micromonospora sp. NPDC023814]|uniref:hypothetical protein n=1 Tax=Micromonospora sp. NPDC023814 TaxID=3154596 RepID=UPI0033CDA89C
MTNFGLNGQKKPTRFIDGGFTYGDGPGSFGRECSVGYEGVSSDIVTVVTETTTTETRKTITNLAQDSDGNLEGAGTTESVITHKTYEDGSSFDETVSTTTNYDRDFNQTDKTTESFTGQASADGTTTTTTTSYYDKGGNLTEKTETTTTDDGETTKTTTTTNTYKDGEVESEATVETCEGPAARRATDRRAGRPAWSTRTTSAPDRSPLTTWPGWSSGSTATVRPRKTTMDRSTSAVWNRRPTVSAADPDGEHGWRGGARVGLPALLQRRHAGVRSRPAASDRHLGDHPAGQHRLDLLAPDLTR